MKYRVIYSEYTRDRSGSYNPVSGTEKCCGFSDNINQAHHTSLCMDSSYHIAWVEKNVEGVWYACDHNGRLYDSKIPALLQDVPIDEYEEDE